MERRNCVSALAWTMFVCATLVTGLGMSEMLSSLTYSPTWYESWGEVPALFLAALPLGVALTYIFFLSVEPGLSAVRCAVLGPGVMCTLFGAAGIVEAHSGVEFVGGAASLAFGLLLLWVLKLRVANGDPDELTPLQMGEGGSLALGLFGVLLMSSPWRTIAHHGFVAFSEVAKFVSECSEGVVFTPIMPPTPALAFALVLLAFGLPYFLAVSAMERRTVRVVNLSILQ